MIFSNNSIEQNESKRRQALQKHDETVLLETEKYYHLYNLSADEKIIFKEDKNYLYFLERYQLYLGELVSTLAYCLLPADFHFVIKVVTADRDLLEKNLDAFLNGYTKAINNGFAQNGNSLRLKVKAREIGDESHLLPLITNVHQLPVVTKQAERREDWEYSSYPGLAGMRNETLVDKDFIRQYFHSAEAFRKYSEGLIPEIKKKYWV